MGEVSCLDRPGSSQLTDKWSLLDVWQSETLCIFEVSLKLIVFIARCVLDHPFVLYPIPAGRESRSQLDNITYMPTHNGYLWLFA